MDFLSDFVHGFSTMLQKEAIEYVATLETQNECELAVREEIFGRRHDARKKVLEAIMDRYDFLDESGVTDRGAPRLTPKELIAHHLREGG
jgi:hypothetical protein